MKRKLPIVECDICSSQQVDNDDPTEILGITINRAFYAGLGGGGPIPKDTFVCIECILGDTGHGPILLQALTVLVFLEPGDDPSDAQLYAPKE